MSFKNSFSSLFSLSGYPVLQSFKECQKKILLLLFSFLGVHSEKMLPCPPGCPEKIMLVLFSLSECPAEFSRVSNKKFVDDVLSF
jgi:hypothetical protein